MFNSTTPPEPQETKPGAQEQPVNWEERFKGMQREYQKLQEKYAAIEGLNTQLQSELNTLKGERSTEAIESQRKITELMAQLGEFTKKEEAYKGEVETLRSMVNKFEGKDAARKRLVEANASDLIPFFETGNLAVEGLEGESLNNKIAEFRAMLESFGQKKVDTILSGSTVTQAPPTKVDGMKPAELYEWLMKPENVGTPEWEQAYEIYLKQK